MYYVTIMRKLSKISSNLEHKFLTLTLLLFHNYYQVLFVSCKLLHSQFQVLRKIIPSSRKLSRNGNQIYKSRSSFIFIGISLDLRELISLWIHEHMDMSYMYLIHTECFLQLNLCSGVSFSWLYLSFTLLFYNKNPQFQCMYSLVHSDNTHKTSSEELDIHSYETIYWKKKKDVSVHFAILFSLISLFPKKSYMHWFIFSLFDFYCFVLFLWICVILEWEAQTNALCLRKSWTM